MKSVRHVENGLSRIWWAVLALLIVFTLACSSGCQFSRVVPDPVTGEPTLVTEGTDVVPGVPEVVEDVTGLPDAVEDGVGAVVDGVRSVDVPEAVKDVTSGNWLGLLWKLAAAGAVIFGGWKSRRKIRDGLSRLRGRPSV